MEENAHTALSVKLFDKQAFDFSNSSRRLLVSRFLLVSCSFVSLFALLLCLQTTFVSNPQINEFSKSSQIFDDGTDFCYNLYSIQHELNFDTSFVCDENSHNFAHNFLLTKNSDGTFVASVKIQSDEFRAIVPQNEISYLCQLLKELNLIDTSFDDEEDRTRKSAVSFEQLNNLVCLEDSVRSTQSVITIVQKNIEDGRTHTEVYKNIRCKNELLQSCPIYYNFLDFYVYSSKWIPSSSSSIPPMSDITSVRLKIRNPQGLDDSFTVFSSGTCLIVTPYADSSIYVMDADEIINLVYSSVLIFKDNEFLNGNGKDCENSDLFTLSLIWKNGDETATVETKGKDCSPESLKTVINFIISLNKTAVWEKPSDKFSFTVIGLIFGAIVLFIVLVILAILFLCYRKENRDESQIRDDLLTRSFIDGNSTSFSVDIPLENMQDDRSDDIKHPAPSASSSHSSFFSGWKIVFTEIDSDQENEPTVSRQKIIPNVRERTDESSFETR